METIEKSNTTTKRSYNNHIHFVGRLSTFILILMFVSIPLGLTLYSGLTLDYKSILLNTLPLALIMGIIGAIEKITMAPIMGAAAIYISSATGNVQNMKFPAAINAMNITGFNQGSDKGEAVALIAVTVSALTTTAIVFLGVIFLAPLVDKLLNLTVVSKAFKYMIPSLMGAMSATFIVKRPKVTAVPLIVSCVFAVLLGSAYTTFQGLLLPIFLIISVGAAYWMYKKGIIE